MRITNCKCTTIWQISTILRKFSYRFTKLNNMKKYNQKKMLVWSYLTYQMTTITFNDSKTQPSWRLTAMEEQKSVCHQIIRYESDKVSSDSKTYCKTLKVKSYLWSKYIIEIRSSTVLENYPYICLAFRIVRRNVWLQAWGPEVKVGV